MIYVEVGLWFSPYIPVSSTNKTDRNEIIEILLKVALNTITITPNIFVVIISINTQCDNAIRKKYLYFARIQFLSYFFKQTSGEIPVVFDFKLLIYDKKKTLVTSIYF